MVVVFLYAQAVLTTQLPHNLSFVLQRERIQRNMSPAARSLLSLSLAAQTVKPNIVLIFPDDQDLHLGSTDYQPVLQREMMAKGTTFTNHVSSFSELHAIASSLGRKWILHNGSGRYRSRIPS
jgi:hypothetical protein